MLFRRSSAAEREAKKIDRSIVAKGSFAAHQVEDMLTQEERSLFPINVGRPPKSIPPDAFEAFMDSVGTLAHEELGRLSLAHHVFYSHDLSSQRTEGFTAVNPQQPIPEKRDDVVVVFVRNQLPN
jgi:hypothetical protein